MKFYGQDLFIHEQIETCTQTDIEKALNETDKFTIDIETGRRFNRGLYDERAYQAGLDPELSKIVMVQIHTGTETFVIDARYKDISFIGPYLESEKWLKIGHNLQFETKFFLVKLGVLMQNVWDTMICEKVLYNGENHSYALAALCKRYLNKDTSNSVNLFNDNFSKEVENLYKSSKDLELLLGTQGMSWEEAYQQAQLEYIDKSTRLGFVNIGDRPFTIKEIQYGAADVVDPWLIYHEQVKGRMVNGELYNPVKGFSLENKVVPLLAKMSVEGISVNRKLWNKAYEENRVLEIKYREKLNDFVVANFPKFVGTIDLFNEKPSCAINWGSSKQVIQLFRTVDKCPREYSKATKRKEWTVGAKSLFALLTKDQKAFFYQAVSKEMFPEINDFQDFILAYLIYKKYEQLTTTFGLDWLRFIHPITKKVHSNFNQYMHTGRMSSTSPNMTNIPGGEKFRTPFHTDTKMVCCDFASQESRVLAEVTQVPELVSFFRDGHPIHGTDMHCMIATNMFRVITGDDTLIITKKDGEKRGVAKALGFALSYGASAFSVKDDLSVDVDEAQVFIDAFFDGLPGLRENFDITKKLAIERGWIELDPITKTRYFFPDFDKMKSLEKEANSLKPANWSSLTREEKAIEKERLKAETNWSQLWREYMGLKGKLERRALNYRIQGLAAKQTKTALIYCHKLKLTVINVIHDEILSKYINEGDDLLLQQAMEKGANTFTTTVPMKAQPVIADHWVH